MYKIFIILEVLKNLSRQKLSVSRPLEKIVLDTVNQKRGDENEL